MYANNFFDDLSYSSIVVPSYRLIEVTYKIKKYFVKGRVMMISTIKHKNIIKSQLIMNI